MPERQPRVFGTLIRRSGLRAILAGLLVLTLLTPGISAAGEIEDAVAATIHRADEYLTTFDNAELPGLGEIGPAPAITGDADLDERIRSMGEARGYQRRPTPNRELVAVGGTSLQPEAAKGWRSLTAAAAAAGHTLWITSGYRSISSQVSVFRTRLPGTSDAAIDTALQIAAMPGYSRHHTGYAVDIRSSTGGGYAFRNTAAYAWLAADDFANAKAHGWIPSYPEGSSAAGPNPEPWEFVWVGAVNIICRDFEPTPDRPFCDTIGSTFADDIEWRGADGLTTGCTQDRFCTTTPVTRGHAATFLWRLAGQPDAEGEHLFTDVDDGTFYSLPIHWMVENDIMAGTTPTTFEPDRALTREDFVTFLWRVAGRPAPEASMPFLDVDPAGFAADAVTWAAETAVTTGTSFLMFSPADEATRGQAAAFLQRFSSLEG